MKFHPILFSTEMVQAILDGRKTQTRRAIKYIHPDSKYLPEYTLLGACFIEPTEFDKTDEHKMASAVTCPYGQPGDVLWVRESFVKGEYWSQDEGSTISIYAYKASPKTTRPVNWKPSIHMPKAACRLFLKIKAIRVERLQDISEDDARAEGVLQYDDGTFKNYFKKKGLRAQDGVECLLAKGSFQSLFASIYGLDSWNANPWVWVIEFERIEKPQNFLA